MPDLTVITPIAPHHALLFEECAASVQGQTVEVQHLYMMDTTGQGPAVVRNLLLAQVESPYVTFLDADDWLEPAFAERTLQAARPARYIFTDWFQDGKAINAPECAWTGGTHHLVTAVLPTAWVREVKGFDESLRGMEDSDFYTKLVTRGFCGKRLPEPLVHYRKDGGRAKFIHRTGEVDALQAEMTKRYGGLRVSCCGGDNTVVEEVITGERGPDDVKARTLWHGNRGERGRATGRHYPRSGNGKLLWVHPADIQMSPHLWQAVPEVEQDPDLPKA
jgi:hypothetical protein